MAGHGQATGNRAQDWLSYMPTPTTISPIQTAADTWKALVLMLSAPGRARMRVWSPDTGKFSATAKLSSTLPARPAALYLYAKDRTTVVALDFDSKLGGRHQVTADVAMARTWFEQCGAAVITDHNPTNGGRHLWALLAHGTTASFEEINHLVRLLGARLPTLDITPVTNPAEGCLTAPGSPCKDGGYRELDGTLDAAVQACADRSDPALLPRLYVLLGAIKPSPSQLATAATAHIDVAATDFTVGSDEDLTLSPEHVTYEPYPHAVEAFAQHGHFPPDRPWATRSHARQSVITHAIWRGHSLATITEQIAPGGPWHDGLGAAYRFDPNGRPRRHERLLARDFTRALDWLTATHLSNRRQRHKRKNTQGGQTGFFGPELHRRWLANAIAWADREFASKRHRHTLHAVFQSLAAHAAMDGEVINGTPVVGVGGRNLSLGTGLLSDHAVWKVLSEVREIPGSPIVLTRVYQDKEADHYALTTQNVIADDPIHAQRVRVEPVHTSWSVLGHHRRRIYEMVAHFGLTSAADVYAAAKVSTSTGDAAVAALATAGLLRRSGPGQIEVGARTLDDVAADHHTDDDLADRVAVYQAEREVWHAWLEQRQHVIATGGYRPAENVVRHPIEGNPAADPLIEQAWLAAVMADGPPSLDDADISLERIQHNESNQTEAEQDALAVLASILGAKVLVPLHH
ncbi:hypothetical protein [Mycobacteroides abscessus]|nr:hypothetical protein [Mycobacteroides abscessus]MBE5408300.1 hypothetical protein [Mycobacteroides abscessus]SIK24750.1 Uncharacterised protein [Mycobacteroides abscessus subsp. abscessus]SIL68222.1 Uncharacterised protein [Mycobacteroides abscessus subsp. abscessus]SIM47362.1 Uncharacterised protein [Mycobacteroides abscessus subsp. abscessus]SLC57432.1 Uncharacterised protein [Mycobacteroides abscessus subsp. massiliense]